MHDRIDDKFGGADEYESYPDPPLRHRKTTKRDTLPCSSSNHNMKSILNQEEIIVKEQNLINESDDDNNATSTRFGGVRRGIFKSQKSNFIQKGKERTLDIKHSRQLKYFHGNEVVDDVGKFSSSTNDLEASHKETNFISIETRGISQNSHHIHHRQPIHSRESFPKSNKSTGITTSRKASEDVECPPERQKLISSVLLDIRSNLLAMRERLNNGHHLASFQCHRNSWTTDINNCIGTTGGSYLPGDIQCIWKEILQWLHFNDSLVNDHLRIRNYLAEDLLQRLRSFHFCPIANQSPCELIYMKDDYLRNMVTCMQQVEDLLQIVDRTEFLFVSRRQMFACQEGFANEDVQQRLASLYMWRRMMHLLNASVYRIFQKLGAQRQEFASLMLDFTQLNDTLNDSSIKPTTSTSVDQHLNDSLDLFKNDMADFEDNLLLSTWPSLFRKLVISAHHQPESIPRERNLRYGKTRHQLYQHYVEKNIYRIGLMAMRSEIRQVMDIAIPFAKQCLKLDVPIERVVYLYESESYANMVRHTLKQFQNLDHTIVGLIMSADEILESVQLQQQQQQQQQSMGIGICSTGTWTGDLNKSAHFKRSINMPPVPLQKQCSNKDTENEMTVWSSTFRDMHLPSFLPHFLFLVRCPLDVLYQCMKVRCHSNGGDFRTDSKMSSLSIQDCSLESYSDSMLLDDNDLLTVNEDVENEAPVDYSSLAQLFRECKETLCGAIMAKRYYLQNVIQVLPPSNSQLWNVYADQQGRLPMSLCEAIERWRRPPDKYEAKLQTLLQDYFRYLWRILTRLQKYQDSSTFESFLENEWKFMKVISPSISDGEVEASRLFCRLVAFFVRSIKDFISEAWSELHREIDEQNRNIELEEEEPSVQDDNDYNNFTAPSTSISSTQCQRLLSTDSSRSSTSTTSSSEEMPWPRQDSSASTNHSDTRLSKMRRMLMVAFRKIEDIFEEARKRMQKAVDNIRLLCNDLQIAASMTLVIPKTISSNTIHPRLQQQRELFRVLHEADHILVISEGHTKTVPSTDSFHQQQQRGDNNTAALDRSKIALFVPKSLAKNRIRILELLSITFGEDSSLNDIYNINNFKKEISQNDYEYLLFVECIPDNPNNSQLTSCDDDIDWPGETIKLDSSADHTVKLSHAEVCGIMLMAANASQLERCYNYFLDLCPPGLVQVQDPHRSYNQSIALALAELKRDALDLGVAVPDTMLKIQEYVIGIYTSMDSRRNNSLLTQRGFHRSTESISGGFSTPGPAPSNNPLPHHTDNIVKVRLKFRDCMQRCYRTAFFYHRELFRMATELAVRQKYLAPHVVVLLHSWMNFVLQWYEPGTGIMPCWAQEGCAFIHTVFHSNLVALMNDNDWRRLYEGVRQFIPHLVGIPIEQPPPPAPPHHQNYHPDNSPAASAIPPIHNDKKEPSLLLTVKSETIHTMNMGNETIDFRRAFSDHLLMTSSKKGQTAFSPSNSNQNMKYMDPTGTPFEDNSFLLSGSPTAQISRVSSTPNKDKRISAEMHGGIIPFFDSQPSSAHEEENATEIRMNLLERLSQIDQARETRLRREGIIGRVIIPTDSNHDEYSAATVYRHWSDPDGGNKDVVLPYERHASFMWQIGRKLGKGTFGDVFEAVRLDTHESIVVKKIIRNPLAALPRVTSAHLNEAQKLEFDTNIQNVNETLREFDLFVKLRHPNLVRYHGIEATRQNLLIFMERCPGRTLAHMVEHEIEEIVIRKYANKLLQAIAYLHELNIVHRDIKPDNIMLCEPSDPELLKLTDFGSAARIHQPLSGMISGSRLSCSHDVMDLSANGTNVKKAWGLTDVEGTPNYMAPEVCRSENYDTKCDIWSFGCVIWELFEGKRPHHDRENSAQILWRMATIKDTLDVFQRPKRATEDSWKFILSCLCVNSCERASAAELLHTDFVKVVICSLNSSTNTVTPWHQIKCPPRH